MKTANLSIPGNSLRRLSESWRMDACKEVETTTEDIATCGRFFALGGEDSVAIASVRGTEGDELINDWTDWVLYFMASVVLSPFGGNRDEYRALAVPQGTSTKRSLGSGASARRPLSTAEDRKFMSSCNVPSPDPRITVTSPSTDSKKSTRIWPA